MVALATKCDTFIYALCAVSNDRLIQTAVWFTSMFYTWRFYKIFCCFSCCFSHAIGLSA